MKIIYSPYFGFRPYVNLIGRGGILFDTKAVGTAGLLDELSMRTGLERAVPSATDRLIGYVKAMEKALAADGSLFFAGSFANDELGTAKVILGWRDALVMACWDGRDGGSERLRGLAAVEKVFDVPGEPDRWVALAGELASEASVPLAGLEVECRVPVRAMPPVIARTLDHLSHKGAAVSYVSKDTPAAPEGTALRMVQDILLGKASGEVATLPEDGTFRYYGFPYGIDAFQMVAGGMAPEEGSVLITGEPKRLNDTLSILDKPLVEASAMGYPQSEQLLLLGLSLFRNPVDVNSLTSYLRVPVNPLGKLHVEREKSDGTKYYRALNRELLDVILQKSGLSGWKETIAEAVYDKDGTVLGKKEIEKVLQRTDMWERGDPSGRIPVDEISAYLKNLGHWADGCAAVTDDSGFAALSACCSALVSLLDGRTGTVDGDTLTKWATDLMEPVQMGTTGAEEGSFDMVSDFRNLVDGPRKAVWLGCVGEDSVVYPYEFLSEEEKRLVSVPSKEEMSRFAHQALVEGIASVKESLTLIGYSIIDGTTTTEHPLMVELRARAQFDAVPEGDYPDGVWQKGEYKAPGTKETEYRVKPDVLKGVDVPRSEGGLRKDAESATSVQTLILHPFDYVMKYVLGMRAYGEADLQDVKTVRGKVAHLYVQKLIERSGKDVGRMDRTHAESFEGLVGECAKEAGAVLLLEENGIEYTRFKATLRESVDHLLALLRRNNLSVKGAEVELKTELPVIGHFIAYVDLLLKDAAGNYVIFDLKWSDGKYYYTKVEAGNILQLAMYREAVRTKLGGKVAFMGYWVFPKHQLVTFEGSLAETHSDIVTYADSGRDIFSEVCRSYTFRMEQLRRGIIEEGETLALADLEYFRKQETSGLYPLEASYDAPECKGRPYGNENLTLKGGLN